MDFYRAYCDGASLFLFVAVFALILHLIGKRGTGEFDYKDFSKFIFYGLALAVAAFIGSLFQIGGWGKE